MKRIRKSFVASMCLLTAFVLWTVAICFVDVRAIGPQSSFVGFAGINGFVHNLTSVHWGLYNLTDWLGLVPIFVCMGFGILDLYSGSSGKAYARWITTFLFWVGFI